jgi:hypothetical protein
MSKNTNNEKTMDISSQEENKHTETEKAEDPFTQRKRKRTRSKPTQNNTNKQSSSHMLIELEDLNYTQSDLNTGITIQSTTSKPKTKGKYIIRILLYKLFIVYSINN